MPSLDIRGYIVRRNVDEWGNIIYGDPLSDKAVYVIGHNYKVLQETLLASDIVQKKALIYKSDSTLLTDIVGKRLAQVLSETILLTDWFIRTKFLTEGVTLNDLINKKPKHLLSDTGILTDLVKMQAVKGIVETSTLTDSILRELVYSRVEEVVLDDSLTKEILKPLTTETVALLDNVTIGSVLIILTDLIRATDQRVLRNPTFNIVETAALTDTILRAQKYVCEETIQLLDSVGRYATSVHIELPVLVDIVNTNIVRTLLPEVFHTYDYITKGPEKGLTDIVVLIDKFTLVKFLEETVELIDSILKKPKLITWEISDLVDIVNTNVQRTLTDTGILTDLIVKGPSRVLSDTTTLEDYFAKVQGKILNELVTLTDVFAKTPKIVFLEWIRIPPEVFTKYPTVNYSESTTLTDSFSKVFTLTFTETVLLVEEFSRSMILTFAEIGRINDILIKQVRKNLPIETTELTDWFRRGFRTVIRKMRSLFDRTQRTTAIEHGRTKADGSNRTELEDD